MTEQVVACSNCFTEFGLKAEAKRFGTKSEDPCRVCNSGNGLKLTKPQLEKLCHRYFVSGTIPSGRGIFSPTVQFNDLREGEPTQTFSTANVNADMEMLARVHKIYCFLYGPPLWQFGKPSEENGKTVWQVKDFDYLIDNCSLQQLSQGDIFYRLQTNVPESQLVDSRFCTPPDRFRKFQRFDSQGLPILYAARDIETCLHECRVSLQDECFVAVLSATKPMKILDLSRCVAPSGATEFEDPKLWLLALLYDGGVAYDICRRLARRIRDRGYDGFTYTSYFQQAAERKHQNIAIFGRPIITGAVTLHSLQRTRINNLAYDWQFVPVVKSSVVEIQIGFLETLIRRLNRITRLKLR